jgi:hypothetical protein
MNDRLYAVAVSGLVSGPFAIYKSPHANGFTLVHLPSQAKRRFRFPPSTGCPPSPPSPCLLATLPLWRHPHPSREAPVRPQARKPTRQCLWPLTYRRTLDHVVGGIIPREARRVGAGVAAVEAPHEQRGKEPTRR